MILREVWTVGCQNTEGLGELQSGRPRQRNLPQLYGGTLTALNKKDGDIRLIVRGNALWQLMGKITSRRTMSVMGELVRP
ncbi:hypothetical protein BV898_14984 [Hypsibius exemplaris]|uniref:Uncharacterized protein n=1 Tax=Hypsibius exemplaris TaxID=2072580 RepID=A0A9X6NAJ6_HYPEX|nr:hypothetical protein BV898_14984 [Hypsibius exemplaris]